MRVIFRAGTLIACLFLFSAASHGQVFDNQCPSTQSSIVPLRTVNITNGHFNDTTCVDVNGNLIFQALNPSPSASDTFTRANGALGSNWKITSGNPTISSNAVTGSGGTDVAIWADPAFVSNTQFAQTTIVSINTGFSGPLVFGATSGASGYACLESTTTIFIRRLTAGAAATLTSSAITGANGDVIKLEITSTGNMTCYRNGVSTLTTTDTNFKSGSPGIHLSAASSTTLNNWSGGNLPVSIGSGPALNGQISCKSIGNSRCVDDSNTQGWIPTAGGDIGAWINSAYQSCFPGTCSIKVYSNTGNLINFSTPIQFTVPDKMVNLECISPGNSNGTGGLVLNFTPVTAVNMMLIDNTKTTGISWVPQEIAGCTFVNNQIFTQGGGGSSANGIVSGTINGGIGWLKLRNSAIIGFGNGVLMQNSVGGWGFDCDNSSIGDSTVGISIVGAQEVFHLTKCRLMSNGRGIKSTTAADIVAVQVQFDSNTILAVDLSTATGGLFSSIGNHYENFNTTNCNYVQSVLNNYFSGGTVLNDTATTNCNWQFNLSGATSNVIDGVAIGTAGQTATNVFQINDPACASFTIMNNTPSVYTTLSSVIGGSTTCNPVGTVITKGASNQKNPYYFSTGAQGAPGIAFFSDPLTGFARVAASTIQGVFGGGDGALFTAGEVRHGSAGRFSFSSAADALNGAADSGLSRIAANIVGVGNGAAADVSGEIRSAKISATFNAAGTVQTAVHIVQDTATLAAGTVTVTLTGSAVFTNATSYTCVADDDTAIAATRVLQNSGSSITITGTGTDVIRYICIGN